MDQLSGVVEVIKDVCIPRRLVPYLRALLAGLHLVLLLGPPLVALHLQQPLLALLALPMVTGVAAATSVVCLDLLSAQPLSTTIIATLPILPPAPRMVQARALLPPPPPPPPWRPCSQRALAARALPVALIIGVAAVIKSVWLLSPLAHRQCTTAGVMPIIPFIPFLPPPVQATEVAAALFPLSCLMMLLVTMFQPLLIK